VSGVPILVEADELSVVVVGGGEVAARRVASLVEAGARVRVIAPEVDGAIAALEGTGRVAVERRRYQPGDVADAVLVIAATDDRAINLAVTTEARLACRLVNVADAGGDGSFTTMAAHRAGTLVLGISAGVPAAAASIRDDLARRFDERYAHALGELASLRHDLLSTGRADQWRRISTAVTAAGFCEAVEAGTLHERIPPWQ
jgi:precorrin-2 dehydrogenase/sirohydrochlorin ferrochelatase